MNRTVSTGHNRTSTAVASSVKATCVLLAYWFPPSSESGAQRPYRLHKYLPHNGYDVSVVCAATASDGSSQYDLVRRIARESASAGARRLSRAIQRVLPYNEQLDWLPAAVREVGQIIRARKIPVVVSTSPPNCTHLAALIVKRKFGIKWVADFRDPIYGNPFRNRRWGYPYDSCLERLIFREADALIAVTDAMAEQWKRRYPQHASKIHLIWNGYDPEEQLAASPIPPRSYKLLTHVGSIYGGRHPRPVLAALARLIANERLKAPSLCVRLTGWIDGSLLTENASPVRELVACGCLEIKNSTVPREQAIQLMAQSDYLLLLDGNERNTAYAVPAKIFEYIQIGRPILTLTFPDSPVERILAGSGIAATCIYPSDSDSNVDQKVLSFLQLSNQPRTPSRWFREEFDGERQAAQLSAVIDGILNTRPVGQPSKVSVNT